MTKFYYAARCLFENMKAAIHCKRYGFTANEINLLCEPVNLREALFLIEAGFSPVEVQYTDNGAWDAFFFRRTPAMLMTLEVYREEIRKATGAVDYFDLAAVCDIPGSKISPIDDTALANVIAPRGHVCEAFAYESWPVEQRKAYIAADADTRRRMVDTVYQWR